MSTTPMSLAQFGQTIKAKYPDYANVPDEELAQKMLAKYPEYKDRVQTSTPSFYNDTAVGRGLKEFGLASGGTENASDIIQGPKFALQHPIEAGKTLVNAAAQSQQELIDRAYREQHSPGLGNKVAGFVHGAESAIPFLGPGLARMGDYFSEGKTAEGIGGTLGLTAPFLTGSPEVARASAAGLERLSMPKPPPVPETGTAVPKGNLIQRGVRSAMGMGEKVMEKTAKRALGDYAEESGQVASANAAKAADHAKQVAKVEGLNEAGQAALAKRAQLHQQTLDDSAALAQAVQQKAQAVRAQGKAMYDQVSQTVQQNLGPDAGAPATDVAALVKHAEDNILAGSRPESIKQFRMMLEQGAAPESVASPSFGGGAIMPGTDLYNSLVERGVISAPNGSIPFRDLGGYITELGDMMYNRNVPNDVFAALRYVRDGMQGMRQQIATQAGAGDALVAANQFWRNYENVYNNTRGVNVATKGLGPEGIGSPIAKIVRAVDPPTIRQIVTGNASERLIKTLTVEDPALGDLARRIKDNYSQAKDLPARYKIKEPSEAPEPKPMPKPPDLARATTEQRQATLDKRINALRSPNLQRWEVVGAITGLIGELTGHPTGGMLLKGSVTGLVSAPLLARALESPRVVEWLTAPTARDLAILRDLDPHQRVPLQQAITQTMIKNRIPVSPEMKTFLLPAQVAAVTAAVQAGRTPSQESRYPTPQSVMLGMKSGDLTPSEGARLLQKLRRSSSAGPTRRMEQPEAPPAPTIPQ